MKRKDWAHLHEIKHLPVLDRVTHKKARHHWLAFGFGAAIVLAGAMLAIMGEQQERFPHAPWRAVADLIEGVGCIPLLRNFEPIWLLLTGE